MNFTREDVNALFSIIPLVLWQIYTPNRRKTQQYEIESKEIRGAPKGYVFGIVWMILYAMIITSGFIYFRLFETSPYYLAAFVLFLANILLNKFWSVAFWDVNRNGKRFAFVIIIVLILTGGAFLSLMGLERAWVSFGLYTPYVLWLVYATYLNYASMNISNRQKVEKRNNRSGISKNVGYYSSSPTRTLAKKPQSATPSIPRFATDRTWQKN